MDQTNHGWSAEEAIRSIIIKDKGLQVASAQKIDYMLSLMKRRALSEMAAEIHDANRRKGFWDDRGRDTRSISEMLLLVVTEVAEAAEALRKDGAIDKIGAAGYIYWMTSGSEGDEMIAGGESISKSFFESEVKNTFEDEIADAIIRLLDLCGGLGIDISRHVELKLAYNAQRPHKHGKKF